MKTRTTALVEVWALDAALRTVRVEQKRAAYYHNDATAQQLADVVLYYERKLKKAEEILRSYDKPNK